MAGTVHGKIECVGSNIGQAGSRDLFSCLVQFFDAVFTRIASNAGTSPTGTASLALPGATGASNASGENAWGVWKWVKPDGSNIYIHMVWSWNNNFNLGPAIPVGGANTTDTVGIQFAQRADNGNPWAGGTANAGADTKTNPVWTAGGSTLCVYPRGNGPGGSGATALSFVENFASSLVAGWRLQCIKDDDALCIFFDNGGTGGYDAFVIFSRYTVHPSITPTFPLMCHVCFQGTNLEAVQTIPNTETWGTLTGTSTTEGGAVVNAGDGVRAFSTYVIGGLNIANLEPNGYTSSYDYHDIWLAMTDATVPTKFGLFGKLDTSLIATVPNIATQSTNTAKDRCFLGSATLLHYKWAIRWDGLTTPGSGSTLAGIAF